MANENTTLLAAGIKPDSAFAAVVKGRADILQLTQATQEAILHPRVAGGIGYAERAALACRIARLNHQKELAAYYAGLLPQEDDLSTQIADPAFTGGGERRLTALLRHVDLVTRTPKEATQADILALREAGIEEADIVRLAEIIAFLNYQSRVIAGLRLLGDIV